VLDLNAAGSVCCSEGQGLVVMEMCRSGTCVPVQSRALCDATFEGCTRTAFIHYLGLPTAAVFMAGMAGIVAVMQQQLCIGQSSMAAVPGCSVLGSVIY
jgi:hypothetical protein